MEKRYPRPREIIIGRVKRVNPFSAFIILDEYDGLEGMVHISEVTNKWVKDIRTHVRVGQTVVAKVMRVDFRKGHINLSLKRVRPREKEEKLKGIKRAQKSEKMLEMAGKDIGASKEEIENIGKGLKEDFGEVFLVFEKSMTDSGKELLIKKGLGKKWVDAISVIAGKVMEIKEKTVKLSLEIKCYTGDGVEQIKKAVKDLDKDISIKYISAPQYTIEMKNKDAKKADKKLRKGVEKITESLKGIGEVNIVGE